MDFKSCTEAIARPHGPSGDRGDIRAVVEEEQMIEVSGCAAKINKKKKTLERVRHLLFP